MKQHAPATARNREPIREVLARVLPERGTVLEIASGSGEHAGSGQGHPLPLGQACPASVLGHGQRLGTRRAGTETARAGVAMLLPQLDALFADRERLPVTRLPRVH